MDIKPEVAAWVRGIYIHDKDPWTQALISLSMPTVLMHTPVVLTYRDQDGHTVSGVIVISIPHVLPWGLEFLGRCWSERCQQAPLNLKMSWSAANVKVGGKILHDTHNSLRLQCTVCKAKSNRVKRPDWLNIVPHRPCTYWHKFPLQNDRVEALRDAFWKRSSRDESIMQID
jgi:hypothetical protein